MEAPPPSTPWRVERQFEPIERVWVLDADALLVGTYDLATGAVRCCRVGAHVGLDALLAGWFAATLPRGGDHRSVGSGLPADQQIPSTPPCPTSRGVRAGHRRSAPAPVAAVAVAPARSVPSAGRPRSAGRARRRRTATPPRPGRHAAAAPGRPAAEPRWRFPYPLPGGRCRFPAPCLLYTSRCV